MRTNRISILCRIIILLYIQGQMLVGTAVASWAQVTRLAMDITGAYTTVREISPGRLFVVCDKRDGTYRSPSRRILGRTIEVKSQ